jgi:hypothetical protein
MAANLGCARNRGEESDPEAKRNQRAETAHAVFSNPIGQATPVPPRPQ